jgi:glucosamine-6-phosphate deaminase
MRMTICRRVNATIQPPSLNEPTSWLASPSRVKTLTGQMRRDNARFFDRENQVPHHVFTMGMGTIMEARGVLMLAFGSKKARAIAEAVERPVIAVNPASTLKMHPMTKIYPNSIVASQLKRADYYQRVYDNKPHWQQFE